MATFLALTSKQSGEPGFRNVRARQIFFLSSPKFGFGSQAQSLGWGGGRYSEEHKAYKFQIWKADMMTEQLFSHQIREKGPLVWGGRQVEKAWQGEKKSRLPQVGSLEQAGGKPGDCRAEGLCVCFAQSSWAREPANPLESPTPRSRLALGAEGPGGRAVVLLGTGWLGHTSPCRPLPRNRPHLQKPEGRGCLGSGPKGTCKPYGTGCTLNRQEFFCYIPGVGLCVGFGPGEATLCL